MIKSHEFIRIKIDDLHQATRKDDHDQDRTKRIKEQLFQEIGDLENNRLKFEISCAKIGTTIETFAFLPFN